MKKHAQTLTTFENSLVQLEEECQLGAVSLKAILKKLSGKGKPLLAIFFCLPFGQIIGLSVPFGLLIAFLGFRMALNGNSIWLPNWMIQKKINGTLVRSVVRQILYCLKKIKPITHPRAVQLSRGKTMRVINGIVLGLTGLFLAISLPIPLISFIAGVAIFLLGLGILNDDGILIAISYVFAFLYIVYVILSLYYISFADIYHWIVTHVTNS